MAIPYDTTILINAIRESCCSISLNPRNNHNSSTNSNSNPNSNSNQNQNSASKYTNITNNSKTNESILGSFYNLNLKSGINVSEDFPRISQLNQNSPPIQWNLFNETSYRYNNNNNHTKEEELLRAVIPEGGDLESISSTIGDSKNPEPSKHSTNHKKQPLESSTPSNNQVPATAEAGLNSSATILKPPKRPSSNNNQKNKGLLNFGRFIRPRNTSSNQNRTGSTSNRATGTINEEDETVSDSEDSSIEYDPEMVIDDDLIAEEESIHTSHHDFRKDTQSPQESDDIGLDDSDDDDYSDDDLVRDSIESSLLVDDDSLLDDRLSGDELDYADDFDSDDYLEGDSDYDLAVDDSLEIKNSGPIKNTVQSKGASANRQNLLFRSSSDNLSVSKITFTRSRTNTLNSRLSKMSSLKRKPPPATANQQQTQMQGTTSQQNSIKPKQSILRDSRSTTSMLSLYNSEHESLKDQEEYAKTNFEKREIPPNVTTTASTTKLKSKLTSLINKKELSLDHYEYVGFPNSSTDTILTMSISIPLLNYTYTHPFELRINTSVTVVEMVGFILYQLERNKHEKLTDDKLNPNCWSLYLVDDDGEMEDDMGSLSRTREVKSYGADEFVLVECTESEIAINEQLTPNPLKIKESDTSLNATATKDNASMIRNNFVSAPQGKHGREMSVVTLPGNLTPTSGVTLASNLKQQQSTLTDGNAKFPIQELQKPNVLFNIGLGDAIESSEDDLYDDGDSRRMILPHPKKLLQNGGFEESISSDEESLITIPTKKVRQPARPTKKQPSISRSALLASTTTPTAPASTISTPYISNFQNLYGSANASTSFKDSKLTKLKNSKTIQSILHSTTTSHYLQQQQQPHYLKITPMTNVNDQMPTYHRWTVWRRQQMSFKNRQPKSLAVDGYQIYILPFNESKGSWYESKTSSFNISQVLKVKQSTKVASCFKVIIKKNGSGGNGDELIKKYYLEAKNGGECTEIVNVIAGLITQWHTEKR